MRLYRVHVGYAENGRSRWRYFDTLASTQDFCSHVHSSTGRSIVLTIERSPESSARVSEAREHLAPCDDCERSYGPHFQDCRHK